MKPLPILFFLFIVSITVQAGAKFSIQPKGGQIPSISKNGIEPQQQINQLGGFFRLREFSPAVNQVVETELVTYFIAKRTERTISFSMNCAKPVQLHFVISDRNHKHRFTITEPAPYYRLEKEFDISKFKNGGCSVEVYSDKNELLYTISFDKVAS